MKAKKPEHGQALVLIILAIVALFGFTALAVDFGHIYAERRRVQSEADTAAFAAAEASINHPDWSHDEILSAGVNEAVLNGYEPGGAKNTINITRTEEYVDPDHPNKGSYEADHVALICYTATFHGTSNVNIVYNESELFRFPARIDLFQ